MKLSSEIGRPLTPRYLAALGTILTEWSAIEFRMQEAIWNLLRIDRKSARTVTSQADIRGLVRCLKALATHRMRDTGSRDAMCRIAKEVESRIDERNRLVHGVWKFDPASDLAVVMVFRNDPVPGKHHAYQFETLSALGADLKQVRQQLEQAMGGIPPNKSALR